MTTLRQKLEAVRDWHSGDASELGARTVREITACIHDLDECETAWRVDASTYRLVPDDIEEPS